MAKSLYPLLWVLLVSLIQCINLSEGQAGHTVYVDGEQGVQNNTCCAGSTSTPCKTLNLAFHCVHQLPLTSSVSVFIKTGNYSLNASDLAVFTGWTAGITIEGNSTCNGSVEIQCEPNAGLTFIESENIVLRNLVFVGCAYLHNSTSIDFFSETPAFITIHSALYFLFCVDVTISEVSVKHSDGMGVVMYSTVGNNFITNSGFVNNKEADPILSGGGGLYIEFAYCMPGNTSCIKGPSNVPLKYTAGSNYYISSSTFDSNKAGIHHSRNLTFILPQKWNHIALGRGGGMSVFFKGHAYNNTIVVNGSTFTNNVALWGAGMFVEHHDWSDNNTVLVYDSRIENNQCLYKTSSSEGTGGGGSRVGYIFFNDTHARNNLIHFEKCEFISNSAYFGGGVSFYAAREPTEANATNALTFWNCTWEHNIARAGSATDLAVWHSVPKGAVAEANFTDCVFQSNSGDYTTELGTVVGIGAMYVDSIPVYFMGSIQFHNNTHSALAAVSTGIYVTANTTAHFVNNTGRTGGAIALLGYAFLEVSPDSKIYFLNNSAEIKGGAILGESIGEHDLISSRNCFIRYSAVGVQPEDWMSTFYFSGNKANGKEDSIYATALLSCIWGGAFGSASSDSSQVFCWNNWIYSSGNCTEEIHSAPAKFNQSEFNYPFNVSVVPGQRVLMPIRMYNDRNVTVTNSSVFIARSISPDVVVDQSTEYISDNRIEVHANPERPIVANVSLQTIYPRVIQTTLNVTVYPCPPGMVISNKSDISLAYCKCGGKYEGRVNCIGEEFRSTLQRGAWIGEYTYKNQSYIVANDCPYCLTINFSRHFDLPPRVSELDSKLCGKINRMGTLCGKCKKGYGPTVNSPEFKCIKCSDEVPQYSWIYYLLTEFLTITIFFIIVIFFNIRATSAPANAYVFFAQVVPVAFTLNANGVIRLRHSDLITDFQDIYTIPYDIWNLNFFRPLLPKYCLSSDISTLQLISTGYVTAVYPLLLIILVSIFVWLYEHGFKPVVLVCRPTHWVLAQFQSVWNIQRSLIHAFATFVLLSYTKFALVSFILIAKSPLIDDQGHPIGPGVAYYDGTMEYLSKEHIPYVVVAVAVLATFVAVPPLILSLPSLVHNLQRFRRWNLNKVWVPGPKLQQFLTAFHGCYKDGTQVSGSSYDYRWFAGLYFVLRVVIFAIYPFTTNLLMLYAFLQFVCVAGAVLFIAFRPYKKDVYNKLDAMMFCLLVAINTLTMYNYHITVMGSEPSIIAFSIQQVLLFLPILYITAYVLVYMYRNCCKRQIVIRSTEEGEREREEEEENEEHTPILSSQDEFLRFTQQTGRLYDINQYRPPSTSSVNSEERVITGSSEFTTNSTTANPSPGEDVSTRGHVLAAPNKASPVRKSRQRNTTGYGSMGGASAELQSGKGRTRSRSRNTWGSSISKQSLSKRKPLDA